VKDDTIWQTHTPNTLSRLNFLVQRYWVRFPGPRTLCQVPGISILTVRFALVRSMCSQFGCCPVATRGSHGQSAQPRSVATRRSHGHRFISCCIDLATAALRRRTNWGFLHETSFLWGPNGLQATGNFSKTEMYGTHRGCRVQWRHVVCSHYTCPIQRPI